MSSAFLRISIVYLYNMINFRDITYLATGNTLQQNAYKVLTDLRIFEVLAPFDPILTGTIPIEINIPGSDLDVVCCLDHPEVFQSTVKHHFGHLPQFSVSTSHQRGVLSMTISFNDETFPIEIFGQSIPTDQQYAYRHMLIEHRILEEHGSEFREEIIRLKLQGMKTEPAFAALLGLVGDPYEALLEYG